MRKLSKNGKLFLEKIEELDIPIGSISEQMCNIFFSEDSSVVKFNKCQELILKYKPRYKYRAKKLKIEIVKFYRYLLPIEAVRSDGRLKNNYLTNLKDSEIDFLLDKLKRTSTASRIFFSGFEMMCWKHYLDATRSK